MKTNSETSTALSIAYLKFVECCSSTEILFRGSLPIIPGSNVFSYAGSTPLPGEGGILEIDKCYTVTQEYSGVPITYPAGPSTAELILKDGCGNKECPSCEQPSNCNCPDGYIQKDNICTKETVTTASYSGQLLTLSPGNKNQAYCNNGLRLYPDITTMTWPILGTGSTNASYTLNQNNGSGPVIAPTANVQSEVWGKGSNPCWTSTTGGRLNIAGVWATGFPNNQELAFEYCVTIEGKEAKQYLIGLAGDNYVKFYIDGNLAVFLDTPGQGVTVPFTSWHTFPITLTPGTHIIKLAGLNLGGSAAFAAEIYDTSLSNFQANLMSPAVSAGNCGTSPTQLEPYIIFSTRDMVGKQVANPNIPGEWTCPDGSQVDYCNGTPSCITKEELKLTCACYMIIPCNGADTFVSNNESFEPYVDGFITVTSSNYDGCAYVVKLDGNDCLESVEAFPDPDIPCNCDLRCFYVENTNGFIYVDADDVLQEVSTLDAQPYLKVCSKVQPVPENNSDDYQIIELGLCDNGECPQQCFKLVNCENEELIIYSNSDSLIPYLYGNNNIVKIIGKEGCWKVLGLDDGEVCDCPIDVTVTSNYKTCNDCIGSIAYKLTSCTNNDVIYTILNLEQYIGQVVKIDCGCYIVEQINYLPSNPRDIKLESIHTSCIECTRVYYKLVDCTGIAEPIITYTDLSTYIKQVVKIENCLDCWVVEETTEYLNATTVVVTQSFDTCNDCIIPTTCECSRITNLNETVKAYGYYDCDNVYHQITLEPGQSSDKICALYWVPTDLYCNCIQFKLGPESYYAYIIPDQLINEKPVYSLCTTGDITECGLVYWNGDNWIIQRPDGIDEYILPLSTSETCPYGEWELISSPIVVLTSQPCDRVVCDCFTFTIEPKGITSTFYVVGLDLFGYPIYSDGINTIEFQQKSGCWVYGLGEVRVSYTLCIGTSNCPIGTWTNQFNDTIAVSIECPNTNEFTVYDHFEMFGECKQGVCPPPVFKNNRTVRPGYNTPICTPEKYDEITCRFADILYKIALEKRYGITNCCPEEDDKWLIKKELIDLQALKDPNYNCPECICSCQSGNTCSTCNCKN